MSGHADGQAGATWNVVVGRSRPKVARGGRGARGGYSSGRYRPEIRPASKRQRVSDGSAVGSGASKVLSSTPLLSIDKFKELNVDDKLERIFACVQDVKLTNERLLQAEQTVNELRNTGLVNKDRINMLAYKSIDSEARQRRNNLVFWGIPESLSEDCLVVLNDFLSNHLNLDPDYIFIQRVHRIGKLKPPPRRGPGPVKPRHRPLIAAFRDYPDVELILSNADILQGSPFGINRDYPQEIVNARKPLFQEKKELKSKHPGAKISIQYPAKLVKDWKVIKDMFPNWHKILKLDRLNQQNYDMSNKTDDLVFDSDASVSHDSDMELEQVTQSQHLISIPANMTGRMAEPPISPHLQRPPTAGSSTERDSPTRANSVVSDQGSRPNSPDRGQPDNSNV